MNYYDEIKAQIINNEITRKVKEYSQNRSNLETYYNVGKLLAEAGKHYGEGIIKEYAIRLTKELGKGYTESNLRYFRQYYYFSNRHTLCDKLTWSHYRTLLSVDEKEVDYYIRICVDNNLSVRELRERIKNDEYKRLPEETKRELIISSKYKVEALVKNPIIIKNSDHYEVISEKVLQKLIMENMALFLKELSNSLNKRSLFVVSFL